MTEKFWAVWRDTGGSAPSKRHPSLEEAIREADRLAKKTNEKYFVLEVVGIVELKGPPTRYREIKEKWWEEKHGWALK